MWLAFVASATFREAVMTVKASLRVVLLANEITVAESEDPALWQYNLAAITGGRMPPEPPQGDRGGRVSPDAGRPPDQQVDGSHINGNNGNGGAVAGGV